ncbi:MAG: hypothetical protein ACE5E8_04800 [Acidimicrobiia bacterium]
MMIGRGDLALVDDGSVELFATGGTPHDVAVVALGQVWEFNWVRTIS